MGVSPWPGFPPIVPRIPDILLINAIYIFGQRYILFFTHFTPFPFDFYNILIGNGIINFVPSLISILLITSYSLLFNSSLEFAFVSYIILTIGG